MTATAKRTYQHAAKVYRPAPATSEAVAPDNAWLTQDGQAWITQDGEFLVTQED